jgi:hypothetical protein
MDAEQKTMLALAADTRKLIDQVLKNVSKLEQYISSDPKTNKVKGYLAAFDQHWAARYGEPYVFAGAKDAAQAKNLLTKLGERELWQRTLNYLASNDNFYVSKRHPFGMLVKDINVFGSAAAAARTAPRSAAVVDCRHQPPCTSDVQHTRRRSEEMKS